MAAWAKLSVPPLQTNPSVWINIDKAKTILFLVCCRRLAAQSPNRVPIFMVF